MKSERINLTPGYCRDLKPRDKKYIGEFYKGEFHGQGIFRHEGREYVGQYKNHKRHGQGTCKYANGSQYIGEWKKGKRHGKRILIQGFGKNKLVN